MAIATQNGWKYCVEQLNSSVNTANATAPVVAGLSATQAGAAPQQLVVTLTARPITMTDATTAGCHGFQKLCDFPAGNIVILGAVSDLAITAAAGITATAAVVGSVGTTQVSAADATLTTTEANIIPSTDSTLTSSAGVTKGVSTAGATFDGTSTPVAAFLNYAVPDAGATGNSTLTVTGTVKITYLNLGDK